MLDAKVDNFTKVVDSLAVHNLKFSLPERWRDLVLDNLYTRFITDNLVALFDRPDATDIQAHRGIEFKRVTTSRGFGRTEHNANLHANLVDKNDQRIRVLYIACHLPECLRHQSSLQAHVRVAHVAFDLCLRSQCGHGVNYHNI